MSCRTNCCKKSSLIIALLAIAVLAVPAFSQNDLCMQDAYNSFNGTKSTLNCTANDVSVAAVTGVSIISGGTGDSCIPTNPFTFVADFTIQTTSNKTRSNIGLFFGTGQNQALTGTCSNSILTPQYTCPGTGGTNQPPAVTCGDALYEELDTNGETQAGTACGDTSSSDNNGAGTQFAVLEVQGVTCPLPQNTVPCPNDATKQCMTLPECTSWWEPTANIPICNSLDHSWQPVAIPGTKSKCSCTTLFIPVQPIEPAVSVAKACSVGGGPNSTTCDAGAETHDVVYTVTITNTTPANEGGVIVDQICDNRYGQIYPASGTCAAGTVGTISSTTCSAANPGTIANGGQGSCTFTVSHGENLSVTDKVTVTGHSTITASATFAPTDSNLVTVTSSDAPTTATTSKGAESAPVHACVTVRYDVTVRNTSAAEESITLNQVGTFGSPGYVTALNDNAYGDITQDHGTASVDASVTGTTCGVATTASGQGTLSGSPGAGAFPQTLNPGTGTPPTSNGGTYTCQFDGVICGTPGEITGLCAHGLSKSDTVSAHLTGDDTGANADTITETDNPFTANVCLTVQ